MAGKTSSVEYETEMKRIANSLKVAIISENPNQELTPEEYSLFIRALNKEILGCPAGGGPKFEGKELYSGILVVVCSNQESRVWLQEKVPQLKPWRNAKLKVAEFDDEFKPKLVKIYFREANLIDIKICSKILEQLKIQNEGLSTEKWRIKSFSDKYDNTLIIYVRMDDNALMELQNRGLKAYFGLSQVTFVVQREQT